MKKENNKIKKAYNSIITVCEKYNDLGSGFSDINDFVCKAKNHLLIIEWEEKYGIKISHSEEPYSRQYININDYMSIQYFGNAKKDKELGQGRSISWEDNNRQPYNEWMLVIGFSTGAYIFGDDYPTDFFRKFWNELKIYKPDFIDTVNKRVYWKLKNAKNIYNDFNKIYKKYRKLNEMDIKRRELIKKEKEIKRIKEELKV